MKKLAALTLGSMIMLNSASFAFSDLTEEHWAYRNVLNMQDKGIISGFEDNTFRPSDSLTREQFITMAVKGLNIENVEGNVQFADVSTDRWSAEYISAGGYAIVDAEENEFRPLEVALREDVAMGLVRLCGLENAEYSLETLNRFSDSDAIDENRAKYVAIAVENGFMSGNDDGTFRPQKALNRAEGATVIFNILNKDESSVNWDGEYISNVDGLTKVKLTKISDTEVNFHIRGMKQGTFGINNNAVIIGNIAKYENDIFDEKTEFVFRFEDSNLIIETSGEEGVSVFAGTYKLDDGTISTIERSENANLFEGSYILGKEYEVPEFETMEELQKFVGNSSNYVEVQISNMSSSSANFSIGGFAEKHLVAIMGAIEKVEDKWIYFDEYEEKNAIELEFLDNSVIINSLAEEYNILNGTYLKKIINPEEQYNEFEATINEIEFEEGEMAF